MSGGRVKQVAAGVGAASCKLCAGTGSMYEARSWFTADGYRRRRCSICAGSGQSSYRCDPEWNRFQAKARAALATPTQMLSPSVLEGDEMRVSVARAESETCGFRTATQSYSGKED